MVTFPALGSGAGVAVCAGAPLVVADVQCITVPIGTSSGAHCHPELLCGASFEQATTPVVRAATTSEKPQPTDPSIVRMRETNCSARASPTNTVRTPPVLFALEVYSPRLLDRRSWKRDLSPIAMSLGNKACQRCSMIEHRWK